MPPSAAFNPEKDMPDLAGKVILITGGTAGVGANTVIALAKHQQHILNNQTNNQTQTQKPPAPPLQILFTGRNPTTASETITTAKKLAPQIPITFIKCDLSSLASVSSAAEQLLATLPRLDILICNAGIMAVPAGLSRDGYEIQFATNQLGHSLLTLKLLPLLLKTAAAAQAETAAKIADTNDMGVGVRVVMVSSTGWGLAPSPAGILFDRLKTPQDMMMGRAIRYGQSKFANVLWARELSARLGAEGILAFSITPGVVATSLVTDLNMAERALVYLTNIGKVQTPQEGVRNLLWAVGAPRESVEGGVFYEPVGKVSKLETKASRDPELGGRLWEWTQKELKAWL